MGQLWKNLGITLPFFTSTVGAGPFISRLPETSPFKVMVLTARIPPTKKKQNQSVFPRVRYIQNEGINWV